ncbi:MAG: hypothetical protein KF681_00660 [Bdellovibrionaceae bacterium]|nr:hypothetical protein [Pseudobdellovibrionaceae bacterium]
MNNTIETSNNTSNKPSTNQQPFNMIKGAEILRELQDQKKHQVEPELQPFELEMLAATNDGSSSRRQH